MKVNTDKLTDTEYRLYKMLVEIWDDVEFHVAVLNRLKSDEEREQVINFIESNKDTTSEDVELMSLHIRQTY